MDFTPRVADDVPFHEALDQGTASGLSRQIWVGDLEFFLTTATAFEASSSWGDIAVTYATLAKTYTNVTSGMEMKMALGRFL